MKLSAHALRSLQELDDTGREAVEQIVRAHIRACRLNGFNLKITSGFTRKPLKLSGSKGRRRKIWRCRPTNTNRLAVMSSIEALGHCDRAGFNSISCFETTPVAFKFIRDVRRRT